MKEGFITKAGYMLLAFTIVMFISPLNIYFDIAIACALYHLASMWRNRKVQKVEVVA